VRFRVIGLDLKGPPISGNSILEPAVLLEDHTQIVVRLREIWIERKGLSKRSDRLFETIQFGQSCPQIVMRFRVIGLNLDGPAKTGDGFFELAPPGQGKSQVMVRLGKCSVQLEGPALAVDRFIEAAQRLVDCAEIGIHSGIVWVASNRLAQPFQGKIVVAGLVSDKSEHVPCIRMIGLHGEDLPVDRLGLHEAPSLVMLETEIQDLWYC